MDNIAYFDNAATTFPKPEEVYVFMDKFYRECGVNVGRGQHKLAARAAHVVEETRGLILELCYCPNRNVVFTHTATEALNIILRGIGILDGFNVYISPFEHNAVTRVLHYLGKTFKFNLFTLAFDKASFTYDLNRIKHQFAEGKPNLVVICHASNVCGVIAPIKEIAALSKPYGAINVIDMCQTMGLIDTNLNDDNIDYAVFAGHKTLYAPLGVAGFICNGDIKLEPLLFGGTGIDSANQELPETIPERFEVASPNILSVAGLNEAVKWIHGKGLNEIRRKEAENHAKLLDVLSRFSNIRLLSPLDTAKCIGVVSAVFEGYGSDDIGRILSDKGIAVRAGLQCAPFAHKFLGTFPSGTVRFSVSYFNNDYDMRRLEQALEFIQQNS